MKRILIVLGGGRANGNTAQLVNAFMKGAKEAGHHVELVVLNKLKVNGCIGCNSCRYGKPCIQKDDFNSIIPKGMLLAGGCGDTNGKPQIDKTNHLAEAFEFGKRIYDDEIKNSEGLK